MSLASDWFRGWLVALLQELSNVILLISGLVLSFPSLVEKIENNPVRRKVCAVSFIVLALVLFVTDVTERRSNDASTKALVADVRTLVDSTSDLVLGVSETRARVNSFGPQFDVVKQGLTQLDGKLRSANARHDSDSAAILQVQKQASFEQLISLAPAIFSQLSMVSSLCNNADNGFDMRLSTRRETRERDILVQDRQSVRRMCDEEMKPLITKADYIRQVLIGNRRSSNLTEEDSRQAAVLAKATGGGGVPYTQIHSAALYLFGLLPKSP